MRIWYVGIDDPPFVPAFTEQRYVDIRDDGTVTVLGNVPRVPDPKRSPWFYAPETKNHPWLDLFQSYSDTEPPFDIRWSREQKSWVIRSSVEIPTYQHPIDYYVVREYFKVGY